MAGGLDQFDLQVQPAKLVGHPVGRPAHVALPGAVGTDAGNAQQLAQFVLELVAIVGEIFVQGSHRCYLFYLERLVATRAAEGGRRLASAAGLQYNGCRQLRPTGRAFIPREVIVVTDQSRAGVAEPVEQIVLERKARQKKKPKRQPPYNVILWDDQDHTFDYVIAMVQKLFGYPEEKGFHIADEVNNRGRAIVLTTTREHAELKRDQIHAFGKDSQIQRCQGSMSATIEPVPQ